MKFTAVNRRVASSNLARGAKFSFSLSQLQNVILTIDLWKSQSHVKRSLDREAVAMHFLICSFHCFTDLLDNAELIPALCLGAGVADRR